MTKASLPALALALAACASGPPPAESSPWLVPSEGQKDVRSGSPLEQFFPLVDGMVYTYATQNEVGEQGLLIARVYRTDARRGELRFPKGARSFEFAADGVLVRGRGGDASYVLKAPLQVGTSWRGEHGGDTRVLAVSVKAETPSGRYEGCVQTLEERLGDRPVRYATTFCPNVGVVSIEAASGVNYELATLKSYGPPIRMRADGSERLPGSVER